MDEFKERKKELMTREQVAAAIEASISTVERLIRNGVVKTVKIGSRTYIHKSEVESLLTGGAR